MFWSEDIKPSSLLPARLPLHSQDSIFYFQRWRLLLSFEKIRSLCSEPKFRSMFWVCRFNLESLLESRRNSLSVSPRSSIPVPRWNSLTGPTIRGIRSVSLWKPGLDRSDRRIRVPWWWRPNSICWVVETLAFFSTSSRDLVIFVSRNRSRRLLLIIYWNLNQTALFRMRRMGQWRSLRSQRGIFRWTACFPAIRLGFLRRRGCQQPASSTVCFLAWIWARTRCCRWGKAPCWVFGGGLRVPAEVKTALTENGAKNSTSAISFRKIPFLVMNKIGIEHVDSGDSKEDAKPSPPSNLTGNADMIETSMMVKRHLEVLQAENGLLKKSIDDLRSEFATSPFTPHRPIDSGKYRESDRTGSKPYAGKTDRRNSSGDKKGQSNEGDFIHLNDELKKPTGIGAWIRHHHSQSFILRLNLVCF